MFVRIQKYIVNAWSDGIKPRANEDRALARMRTPSMLLLLLVLVLLLTILTVAEVDIRRQRWTWEVDKCNF